MAGCCAYAFVDASCEGFLAGDIEGYGTDVDVFGSMSETESFPGTVTGSGSGSGRTGRRRRCGPALARALAVIFPLPLDALVMTMT